MPTLLTIPFLAFKLKFHGGNELVLPMRDLNALQLGTSPELLAGKYAEQFQKIFVDPADYLALVKEADYADYFKAEITLKFNEAKDQTTYPDFSLDFFYYWKQTPHGFWAVVPNLGVEAMSTEFEELEVQLEEAIRLSFIRNKRLKLVQKIAATIWFEEVELIRKEVQYKVYSLTEQEEVGCAQEINWLSRLAFPLDITQQQVWHRDKELNNLSRAVQNDFNSSVLLVGKSGVGKSALIMELARKFRSAGVDSTIWETNASRMIRELTEDTGWEENFGYLCQQLAATNDFLFVQNLSELFEVGQYEGSETSMADALQTYLNQGKISILTECTAEELTRIELKAPNFLSLFQIIRLEEPTKNLEKIITGKVQSIAKRQKLKIERTAIEEIIRLSRRFSPYAGMPGRPIRFLESLLLDAQSADTTVTKITRAAVIKRFSQESGLPLFMIDPEIPLPLEKIKQDFNQEVSGQELAVDNVLNMLATVKTNLSFSGKPIASYLFVGPTGVGKTELAKVLSKFMFGHEDRMIRFDMSEYAHPMAVERLLGSSFFTDGLLTSAVRREPFSVLLFDEIEKSHRGFQDLLLQILDEGRLTDSQGKTVNFCSTIIIMTSNIGAANLQDHRISWKSTIDKEEIARHFEFAVQQHFRPELYNRIDRITPFSPLSQQTIARIVKREIAKLKEREGIKFRNLTIDMDDSVFDFLGVRGYDRRYGARYLQRTIREELIIPLSRQINLLDFENQTVAHVSAEQDRGIRFEIESDEMALDLWMETLNKINDADFASDLRRKIYQLMGGRVYVHLLARIEQLEGMKKRLKENFWKDEERTRIYTELYKIKETFLQLKAQVEKIELDLALIKMDMKPNQLSIRESLKPWEINFWRAKLDLFLTSNDAGNKALLGIFGANLTPILDFYKAFFTTKEYEYTVQGVWYRKAWYERLVPIKESKTGEMAPAHEYIISDNLEVEKYPVIKPPETGDVLYGLIFKLKGDCPILFLENEPGFQEFEINDKLKFRYWVQVAASEITIPPEIHRQKFYKKAQRHIKPEHLTDTRLKINREVSRDGHLEVLLETLEELFRSRLDQELF